MMQDRDGVTIDYGLSNAPFPMTLNDLKGLIRLL